MEQRFNNDETASTMGPRPLATKPVYNRKLHTLKNGIMESRQTYTPRKELLKYTSFKKPIHDTLVQPDAKHGRKLYRSMLRDQSFLKDIKLILRDKLAQLKEEHTVLENMLNYNEDDTQDIAPLFDVSPSTYNQQQSHESDQDNNALQFILSQLEHTVSSSSPIAEYTPLTNNYANQILNPNINHLSLDLRRATHTGSILNNNNNNNNNNNINGSEITDFERLEYVLDDFSDSEVQQQQQQQQQQLENNNNESDNNVNSNDYYNRHGEITIDDDEEDEDEDEDDDDGGGGIEDDESARKALSLLIAKYGI